MYEAYFGVSKNPFMLSPDPSFLYLTESHREAYAGLMYALTARKGFVVLTGEVGTGKTTLLHAMLKGAPQCHFSLVLNPSLSPSEFLEFVMHDFGIDLRRATNKAQRLVAFYQFLTESLRQGRTPVLVVDEAHCLDAMLLEEIRLLTNFENSVNKLLQIVLVGQTELDDTLDRKDLRQLKQRVAVRLSIDPLRPADVEQYVLHRWRIAGGRKSPFTEGALERIWETTGGIPRLVNTVCDNALLVAFASDSTMVTEAHVYEAAADLHLVARTPRNVSSLVLASSEPNKMAPVAVAAPVAVEDEEEDPEWAAISIGGTQAAEEGPPSIPREPSRREGAPGSGSMLSRWFGRLRAAGG
jgi:general secretion pathway protein A